LKAAISAVACGTGSIFGLASSGTDEAAESMDMIIVLHFGSSGTAVMLYMLVAWNQQASRAMLCATPASGPSITTVCSGREMLRNPEQIKSNVKGQIQEQKLACPARGDACS
jgi:hypothetical protein